MQYKFDPIKFGPGIWNTIHCIAANQTNTLEEKKFFVKVVYTIQKNFKCQECKVHFGEYLEKHPPILDIEKKHTILGDIGCFMWTWEFHNHVNSFLGKPVLPLEQCYNYYKQQDIGLCFDCGKEKQQQKYSLGVPDMVSKYREGKIIPKFLG
jgi:hypothetical protein